MIEDAAADKAAGWLERLAAGLWSQPAAAASPALPMGA